MAKTTLTPVPPERRSLRAIAAELRSIIGATRTAPRGQLIKRLRPLPDDIDHFDEAYRMRDSMKGRS